MSQKKALVVGASGGIGQNLIQYLSELGEWEIVGLSRRKPSFKSNAHFISVDLLNQDDAQAKLGELTDITHIFYTAFYGGPTFSGPVAENLAMLTNVIETVEPIAPLLERVVLIQGGKVYGRQLGPFKTPAKESDPRHMPPNFYFDQEDFLTARSADKNWSWTALRAEAFCSEIVGIPSLPLLIAVYATISKELGLPLRFPGMQAAYDTLVQVTDAGLLAEAMTWAATSPGAADEAFNLTNGDAFRWSNLWPQFAKFFDMEYAPPQDISLVEVMADKEPLWKRIVERYGLEAHSLQELAIWPLGDFLFHCNWDVLLSATKVQQAGFHQVVDSETMFMPLFQRFRDRHIIP
ncbi:SDR family oxidoreductase [Nodosilinea sp. LEGE 07298]|uniref:SDR family oxidoreductase n=1 Tax=Nodosilinea sp. LEGE 07298 TaxID=2777970 RepID=UPI00187E7AAB|nr:SDR family oxidoreductase [Nodosilinea sp. LEGE 07298]MBE9108525.1 SDR family oxidoreductase [Nodosilinea sp. LEGE 07298]